MRERWLFLLSVTVIGVIVFVFFILRLRPVQIPTLTDGTTAGSLTTPSVTFINPARGAEQPKITLVVFSDFECPACKQLETSLSAVLRARPDSVRVVWKDMPIESAHTEATPAAVAAHCAAQQGKFWEYHDELFARQTFLDASQYPSIADAIGLNKDRFTACNEALDTLPIVKKDFDEGRALGITATPTTYIGSTPYVGALSAEELLSHIDQELNKAP